LSRYFLIDGIVQQKAIQNKLWQLAEACMPQNRCADYTQAIMDFGATCCTTKNPSCDVCPLQTTCLAKIQNKVANYPHKKPKKLLPRKEQQFLLLHTNDDLIYLEKRPPTGLWGGLWCLPSIDINCCPTSYIETTYQLQTEIPQQLVTINHSFSHFHLKIKALAIKTKQMDHQTAEYSGKWFFAQEIGTLGLAKPVSMIINFFLTRAY
jgi:A/G-specific adenine glycosylase